MPDNLDVTGIIPYPPSPDYFGSASPPVQASESLFLSAALSNSAPTDSDSASSDIPGKPSLHHDALPVKPPKFSRTKAAHAPQRQESASPTSTATSVSPPSPASPVIPHPSLHDIERQRRQELLARKAVQASRRPKLQQWESVSSNSASDCKDQDMERSADIPQVSVDDFLNSIGPALPSDNKIANHISHDASVTDIQHLDSAIDVDIRNTDFVVFPAPVQGMTPPHSPSSVQSSSASVCSYSASPTPDSAATVDLLPPPHILSSASPLPDINERVFDSNGHTNGTSSRRGLKRPVAADFVDIDAGPSHTSTANGHVNDPSIRKMGSFASVSGVRRCVINLSDSEDDGAMDGSRMDLGNGRERFVRESSRVGSTTPILPPTQPRAHSGRGTPITPSVPPGALSPAALLEKEEEIRRMRELIAQREKNRLKKLALVPLYPHQEL